MYKKLVSLVLAAIMAVGMLAGCSQNAEDVDVESADTEATSRVALTLTMWLPSENTTPEAEEAVEEAAEEAEEAAEEAEAEAEDAE